MDTSVYNSMHWGSISEDPLEVEDDVASNVKCRNWSQFEVPPLYQPCSNKTAKKDGSLKKCSLSWMKPPLDSNGQNYMLQSIELQQYKRRLKYMLAAASTQQSPLHQASKEPLHASTGVFTATVDPLPSPPPPPKRFCSNEGRLLSQQPSSFLEGEYEVDRAQPSGFLFGRLACPVALDRLSARQLMLKATSAVLTHVGFDNCSESALATLTDIVVEQQEKLCRLLHTRTERSGAEPIESLQQTLLECGVEGVLSLQDYWNTRVKKVALTLEAEDRELLEEYKQLRESSIKSSIKEES